jgi:hypothetical protein
VAKAALSVGFTVTVTVGSRHIKDDRPGFRLAQSSSVEIQARQKLTLNKVENLPLNRTEI